MKTALLSLFLLLGLAAAAAQAPHHSPGQAHGTVFGRDDAGRRTPLVGARVQQLGTTRGTLTDSLGHFRLTLDPAAPARLVVSYVGLLPDTVSVGSTDIVSGIEVSLVAERSTAAVEITTRATGRTLSALTAQRMEIITTKELGKAACCNLGESFETNPSVDVNFADAVTGARQIQLLGLAGPYTDVSVDGLPLLSGLGRQFGLSYIPGPWVQSIQVAKGPGSVVQGYEAIAGLVNVTLKDADFERTHLNAYYNHLGRTELNGVFSHTLSPRLQHTLFTHLSALPPLIEDRRWTDANADGFLDLPRHWQLNLGSRLRLTPSDSTPWRGDIAWHVLAERRDGGQPDFLHRDDEHPLYAIAVDTRRLTLSGRVGYVWSGRPYQSLGLQWGLTGHRQTGTYGLRAYTGQQTRAQANLIFQSIIGTSDHAYRVGLSYVADAYDEAVALPTQADVLLRRRESVPGAFAEYTFSYLERWLITLGARVDAHNLFGTFVTPRLHVKYSPTATTTLRAQLGQGRRVANPIADNPAVLPTSRRLIVGPDLRLERAWNAGLSLTQSFTLWGRPGTLGADLYHTRFENQIIADFDRHADRVHIENLAGRSFATALQLEADYELLPRLDLRLAWKLYDVQTTTDGRLQPRMMVPRQRTLVNLAYEPRRWRFDATLSYTGTQRLPSMQGMPLDLQRPERSPSFVLLNAQVTRVFRRFDLYLGGENLLGFRQADPLVTPDHPFGPHFDSAMAWGPVVGRVVYVGIRYSFI